MAFHDGIRGCLKAVKQFEPTSMAFRRLGDILFRHGTLAGNHAEAEITRLARFSRPSKRCRPSIPHMARSPIVAWVRHACDRRVRRRHHFQIVEATNTDFAGHRKATGLHSNSHPSASLIVAQIASVSGARDKRSAISMPAERHRLKPAGPWLTMRPRQAGQPASITITEPLATARLRCADRACARREEESLASLSPFSSKCRAARGARLPDARSQSSCRAVGPRSP